MTQLVTLNAGRVVATAAIVPPLRSTGSGGGITEALDTPPTITELSSNLGPSATSDDVPRIQSLREHIANGTYLTDHKLEAVVDSLWQALRAGPAAP